MPKSRLPHKSSLPASSRALADKVLAHVHLYRLTTQTAVAALLLGGDRQAASHIVQAMVNAGELRRFGKLLVEPGERLTRAQCVQRYGALWFTCLTTPLRPALATEQLDRLTRPLIEQYQLPPIRHALCYADQTNRRLALIRVQPPPRKEGPSDLQRVLTRLQSEVNAPSFKLWSYFAMGDGFVLSFLMWRAEEARELGLWLRRRPLVSRLVHPWVEIPVIVRRTRLPP